jgi:hypothetical protein
MGINFGDMFRNFACNVDEMFVESTGRPLMYYELHHPYDVEKPKAYKPPVSLRGFYEIPLSGNGVFGDEMDVEVGYKTTIQKISTVVAPGDMVIDCAGNKWVVVQCNRNDDNIRGQNRLVLTVQRFQESITAGAAKDAKLE